MNPTTIKCGHMVLVLENGRYVGSTSMLTLIVETAREDVDMWVWKCLPFGNGAWAYGTPEYASEEMHRFLELNLKELEAIV